MLTTALTNFQTLLNSKASGTTFNLDTATLGATSFLPLLQNCLQLGTSGLQVTGTLQPQGEQLVLSGTANVLGMTGASVTITFSDTAGFDCQVNQYGTSPAHAVGFTMTMAITPTSTFTFGGSFSALSGTLFDQLTITNPQFYISSCDTPLQTPAITATAGLSFYGTVAMTGPLANVATMTGVTAAQAFYGPIAWSTDTTPVPLAAIASPPLGSANVVATLASTWISAGNVSTSVQVSTLQTVPLLGTVPLTGTVTSSTTTLQYTPLQPVAVASLASLTPSGGTAATLPRTLNSAAYSMTAVSMTFPSASSGLFTYALTTPTQWSPISGPPAFTLTGIGVTLAWTSTTAVSATIDGTLAVGTSGSIPLTVTSTNGFSGSYQLTVDPSGTLTLPAMSDLVNQFGVGTNFPVTSIGQSYTINSSGPFTISVTPTTTSAAVVVTSTSSWSGWNLVNAQTLQLNVPSVTVSLAAGSGGGGSIAGNFTFIGNSVPLSVALPMPSTAITATLPSNFGSLSALAQTLYGSSAALPSCMSNPALTGGTLAISGGALVTGSTFTMSDSITMGAGTLTNVSGTMTTSASATSLSLTGSLQNQSGTNKATTSYPFATISFGSADGTSVCPMVQPFSPKAGDQWVNQLLVAGLTLAYILILAWKINAFRTLKNLVGAAWANLIASGLVLADFLLIVLGAVKALSSNSSPGNGAQTMVEGTGNGVTPQQLAPALAQTYSLNANDCAAALQEGFKNMTITVQQMADALAAAGYTPAEVAPVLQQDYPSETATATLLAPILVTAYSTTTTPLTDVTLAQTLQGVNFSFYDVAPPVITAFLNTTSTMTLQQIVTDVMTAYAQSAPATYMQVAFALAVTSGVTQQQAQTVLSAEFTSAPPASDDVSTIVTTATQTQTIDGQQISLLQYAEQELASAASAAACANALTGAVSGLDANTVASILYTVYSPPPLTVGSLATALSQPFSSESAEIATALILAIFPTAPAESDVALALAIAGLPASEAAPILFTMFGGTASQITAALAAAYSGQNGAPSLSETELVAGLAACDAFNLLQIAPAVATQFLPASPQQSDIDTLASDLAANMSLTVTSMELTLALAACSNVPPGDIAGAVSNADAPTSAQSTLLGSVLTIATGGTTSALSTAAGLAISTTPTSAATSLAAITTDPNTVTGLVQSVCMTQQTSATDLNSGVTAGFTAANLTPPTTTQMAAAIALAFAPLTAAATASLLANAGFDPSDTALALLAQFPGTSTGDAGNASLMTGLLAGAFSSLTDVQLDAALLACNFTLAASTDAVVAQFSSTSLSTLATDLIAAFTNSTAMELAVGFGLASEDPTSAAEALTAAFPTLTASQSATLLDVVGDSDLAAAFSSAESDFAAGNSATTAITDVVNAQNSIDPNTAAGAVFSAYLPQLSSSDLTTAITSGFAAANVTITTAQVNDAVNACFAPTVVAGTNTVLSLDTVGSYVSIPSISAYSFSGTGDFSLQVQVQSGGNNQAGMILQCQSSSTSAGWALNASVGSNASTANLTLTTMDSSGNAINYQTAEAQTILDGNWHSLVAMRQTTSGTCVYSIYVDGGQCDGFQPSNTSPLDVTNTATMTVGASSGWQGDVANVYLFADAQTNSSTGTPVGNWPFTDGTADDASSNANDGTLEGGASLVDGTP